MWTDVLIAIETLFYWKPDCHLFGGPDILRDSLLKPFLGNWNKVVKVSLQLLQIYAEYGRSRKIRLYSNCYLNEPFGIFETGFERFWHFCIFDAEQSVESGRAKFAILLSTSCKRRPNTQYISTSKTLFDSKFILPKKRFSSWSPKDGWNLRY